MIVAKDLYPDSIKRSRNLTKESNEEMNKRLSRHFSKDEIQMTKSSSSQGIRKIQIKKFIELSLHLH